MSNELMKYVKKMSAKSMRLYYILLAAAILMLVVLMFCDEEKVYFLGTSAFVAAASFILYCTEHSRRKSARKEIEVWFEQQSGETKGRLLEELKAVPKRQWKRGFAATPEITFYADAHGVHGVPTDTILWVYEKIDTYFPIFRYYTFVMCTMEGRRHNWEIGMNPVWSETLRGMALDAEFQLRELYPGIISGYTRDMVQMYLRDRNAMKERYAERQNGGA